MSVRSGQSITALFTTRAFATGVATDATGTPTGTLYVNGTSDAATVTVTNLATGIYKAAVTLPTLAVGDLVEIRINATVSSVADNAVIWRDTKDVVIDAAGLVDANMVKLGPSGSGTAQTARDVGGNVDAAITSRMATYTQPTGFLAATFPSGTIANTTNITAFAAGALDAVWSTATRTITGGTITTYTGNTPQTGDAYAIVSSVVYGNPALQNMINTLGGFVDTEVVTIVTQTTAAAIRSAIGLATANLDAQLMTDNNFIGSEVSSLVDKTNGLIISQGTIGSTGNTTTTIHMPTLTYADDNINNNLLVILDVSTSQYHTRWIEDWANATKLATVLALPFTPANGVDVVWVMSMKRDLSAGGTLPAAVGAAMTLTTGERTAIATEIFKLDLSTITGEAARSLLNAIRKLRNKWSISGTTLSVFKEDGSTVAYTQPLTPTAGADPITGVE